MQSDLLSIKKKSSTELAIIIIKIAIISFFSIYFLSNIDPYYTGQDSYLYGLGSIGISEGTYEKTNPFLEETGRYEFVPRQWIITVSNTVIPSTSVGLMVIGSVFYSIFGYYGLFYLVPVSSIILLIFSERIATKLFGSIAGLTSLLLISSNLFIIRTGTDLLTENISTVFLLIGFFFLLKFFENPKTSFALILSTALTISTLIRISNSIFFPFEMFLIIGFFIIKIPDLKRNQNLTILSRLKISKKSIYLFFILLLPWISFLIFQLSYNDYYFGDPFTKYVDVRIKMDPSISHNLELSSLLTLDGEKFEKVTILSQYLLPYPFSGARTLETNFEDNFGSNWLGIPPLVFLGITLSLAFFKKIKRRELLITLGFVGAVILFYSSVVGTINPDRGVAGRYMIPSFVFVSFIYGFVIQKITSNNIFSNKNFFKIIKILTIICLVFYFIFALNYVTPITDWLNSENKFKNPYDLAQRYPLDMEGLTQDSIILNTAGSWVVDYGATPFHPFLGMSIKRGEVDESKYPQEPIILLRELLEEGHDVYTFKESSHRAEKRYLNYLVNNHGLILKDFSKTFCKLELKEKDNTTSDQICLQD